VIEFEKPGSSDIERTAMPCIGNITHASDFDMHSLSKVDLSERGGECRN